MNYDIMGANCARDAEVRSLLKDKALHYKSFEKSYDGRGKVFA